jgi:enoyl-CoA hydratase
MEYKNILFSIEDRVALIIFNRPDALNAMNIATMLELHSAVNECNSNTSVRSIILSSSSEKAFVAGADISEMQDYDPQNALSFMELGHEVLRNLEIMQKPSVAVLSGFVLGGGMEIAMACDMRFASEKTRFGQPEILIGLIPGWGGTQRLSRLIGLGRAKELVLGGAQIDARRAYEIGLVNQILPAHELMPHAKEFARKLAGLPAFAIKMGKHSMNFGYDIPLDNAIRLEMECCAQCFSTNDQKEGMRAFIEKRKPKFS